MGSRVLSRASRGGIARLFVLAYSRREPPVGGFHSLRESAAGSVIKYVPFQRSQLLRQSILTNTTLQRFGYSSSASPQPNQSVDHDNDSENTSEVGNRTDADEFSDEKPELSFDELVKLVAEKEELLKLKHKEIEKMQDKVLRSYAEMENVMDRTKREAENAKKFAIQNFAKSLLDVADNLGRASSVVKESFSKIDSDKDTVGAVPLLKTLLEGVEMTEKQLSEVFRKFGVEKFDPINEQFDPHRHLAVFQIPDASKPPATVAAVLKSGYTLHDRVIRPAEVGVTQSLTNEPAEGSNGQA